MMLKAQTRSALGARREARAVAALPRPASAHARLMQKAATNRMVRDILSVRAQAAPVAPSSTEAPTKVASNVAPMVRAALRGALSAELCAPPTAPRFGPRACCARGVAAGEGSP